MANVKPDIVVVGASARAAAFSALRAGLTPLACDLYADRDTRAACPSLRIPRGDYPDGIPRILAPYAPAPVVYTGGLENRPDLVEALSELHPICGNPAAVLREARSPSKLRRILRERGVACPEVRPWNEPPEPVAGWLRKPLRGSGGTGVRPAETRDRSRDAYFQREVAGTPVSAVYVAGSRTTLLGVTLQLVGEDWLDAPRFAYCGSVGPLPLRDDVREAVTRAGEVVATAFGLRGLFGLDFVTERVPGRAGRDRVTPWVVELNPRYTASVEVLEEASGVRALAVHSSACEDGTVPGVPARGDGVAGKAVLFAPRDIVVRLDWSPGSPAHLADIPAVGERIRRGRPVLTVFARGADPGECLLSLRERARVARELATVTEVTDDR